MSEGKDLIIRNSTAEFLIFEKQAHADSIEVRYEDETLWLTQKMMSNLFDVESNTITYHLQEIFKSGELDKESTTRKFRVVQTEGTRQVSREVDHYNLDAVISVGYRVNSIRATQFRRWATQVLKQYAITGYVIDRKRMENGAFLGEDYFERLLEEIREIRLSERRFYQKVTDIYATSVDYDKNAPTTKLFFATVQNKIRICCGFEIPEAFDVVNLVEQFKPLLIGQIETQSAGEQEALQGILGNASADIPFVVELDEVTISGKLNAKYLCEDYPD